MKIFNTLADLQAARFASTGQLVQVKGTDTTGDGGIDFFLIQNSGTPDGVDVFATAGGKVAVRQKGAKASLLAGRAKVTDTTQFATGTTTEGVVANDATWLSLVGTTITVETQGFHSGSTVGNAKYKFLNGADSAAAGYVNGSSRFQIRALDVYACLVVGDIVEIEQFGASTTLADNSTQIQAAIDFSFNLGFGFVKPIHIPAGVYLTTGVDVKSYVTLFGDGDMSILSLPTDVPAGTYSIVSITTAGANSITLRDFSVWGDNNNQANSPTVYGVDVNTSAPATYNQFRNLYIKECQSNGIVVRGSGGLDNSKIINCMIRDTKGSSGIYIAACDKLGIVNCRIRSGKIGSGHGILAEGAGVQRLTIEGGCRFDDNNGWAIYCSNVFGQVQISDFQATNNDEGGVYLDRCDQSHVKGGILSGNGDTATASQVKVELSDDVEIDVQIIGGTGYGLHIDNSNDCAAKVKISGRAAVTSHAVLIDACDGTELSGSLKDCGGHGVFNLSSSNGLFTALKLKNIGQVTNNAYSGVVLDNNSDNNTLQTIKTYSSVANKMQYGIWVANASADNNFVANNDLSGYVTAGVQDNGTGTVTTSGNRV